MQILIVILFIAIFIAIAIWSHLQAKKRREAMAGVARSLGFRFHGDEDHSMDDRYPFLNKLCQGSRRYAFNVMWGDYQGHDVQVFDYHYETYSRDSKGRRQTHHHYFSFFCMHVDADFPELLISREGWFDKVTQFFGFDDIDFESAEFSKLFVVKSSDKKFAYDICNAQMIEYLLDNVDLCVEIERHCVTLFFNRRLYPEQIEPNLRRLLRLRNHFPGYLMT